MENIKNFNLFEAKSQFITFKKFKELKKQGQNLKMDVDPYDEENWLDDKIPSFNSDDYEVWFKLKKDFDDNQNNMDMGSRKYKKDKKFDCMGGMLRGISNGNIKINFDDDEWFEPVLKFKNKY